VWSALLSCHKFCGTKIELHHIVPEHEGGLSTLDNAIPLCFDCHADVQHYNAQHPRGRKFTGSELRAHRDAWYAKVAASGGTTASAEHLHMDRTLFTQVRQMFTGDSDLLGLLRDADLGSAFELKPLNCLHAFRSLCREPEAEFMDAELESLRANLFASTNEFLSAVARHTFPCSGLPRRNEIPPEWQITQPARWFETRDKLDGLATDLYQKYDEFVRACRRRLGIL
jgi:hypothetical protein